MAIGRVNQAIIDLAAAFKTALESRGSSPAIILPQKDAAQKLREISTQRGGILRAELSEIQNAVTLSQERISLLLRFRSDEADPDGQISAQIIEDDLRYAATSHDFASVVLESLGSYEPLTQEEQDELKNTISVSLAETKRILTACMGAVLTKAEEQEFHRLYECPADSLSAFQDKTGKLQESALRLVDLTASRVRNTMDYVDIIDRIVVPAFPDHAEGMKIQAEQMLMEAAGSFTRMDGLILRSEQYGRQLANPPVRGPSI